MDFVLQVGQLSFLFFQWSRVEIENNPCNPTFSREIGLQGTTTL